QGCLIGAGHQFGIGVVSQRVIDRTTCPDQNDRQRKGKQQADIAAPVSAEICDRTQRMPNAVQRSKRHALRNDHLEPPITNACCLIRQIASCAGLAPSFASAAWSQSGTGWLMCESA